MTDVLRLAAPAKVNLFLRVLGRRPDGFHDIETLFQAVDLSDEVQIQVGGGTDVGLEVLGADLGPTEDNLAYRAARALLDAVGVVAGVWIRLEKRIPAGGGLGGGSSDAAAVLRGLNHLLGTPLGQGDLLELGAALGSDVPFFLGESPTAVGRGRGELLEAVSPLPEAHLVLVMPPVHVSTADAYRALGRGDAAPPGPRLGDPPKSWAWASDVAHNDFQDPLARRHEEIRRALEALAEAGAQPALLSGSGAVCFGRFESRSAATRNAASLQERLGWPCRAVRTIVRFQPLNPPGVTG